MTDPDFGHFLPAFNFTPDPNKFFSDSQSIGISPLEHVRHSQVHTPIQSGDGSSRSRAGSYPSRDFAPYSSSGAGSLPFRGQPISAAFPSTADPTTIDFQGYGMQSEHLPTLPDNFQVDFDSAALLLGQNPSFSPFTANDGSSTHSLASALNNASTGHPERSYSMASDVSGLFSPAHRYDVSPAVSLDLLKGIETCSESRRTCMTSAIRILQTLHIPSSACLSFDGPSTSSASRQPRKTDSVLSANRDIVRLMAEMIKCSCISSSQLQLVLIIICNKLIAWYRAIIRNSPDDHPDVSTDRNVQSSTNPDGTLNAATSMTSERVLHQPFAVGEYSFDTGLESKIRAQVVSSELQQLEALVANLSGRIQEENPSGNNHNAVIRGHTRGKRSRSTSTIERSGFSSAVHTSLTTFLHTQLKDAKAESTAIATREV
ncbi:hypothetical protein MMC29_006228 [Sticta canariensis]|nr:hypothetical protein [Sticta canariensis]